MYAALRFLLYGTPEQNVIFLQRHLCYSETLGVSVMSSCWHGYDQPITKKIEV